jgi:hypothetical protein
MSRLILLATGAHLAGHGTLCALSIVHNHPWFAVGYGLALVGDAFLLVMLLRGGKHA